MRSVITQWQKVKWIIESTIKLNISVLITLFFFLKHVWMKWVHDSNHVFIPNRFQRAWKVSERRDVSYALCILLPIKAEQIWDIKEIIATHLFILQLQHPSASGWIPKLANGVSQPSLFLLWCSCSLGLQEWTSCLKQLWTKEWATMFLLFTAMQLPQLL